jgi:hypothetical protein
MAPQLPPGSGGRGSLTPADPHRSSRGPGGASGVRVPNTPAVTASLTVSPDCPATRTKADRQGSSGRATCVDHERSMRSFPSKPVEKIGTLTLNLYKACPRRRNGGGRPALDALHAPLLGGSAEMASETEPPGAGKVESAGHVPPEGVAEAGTLAPARRIASAAAVVRIVDAREQAAPHRAKPIGGYLRRERAARPPRTRERRELRLGASPWPPRRRRRRLARDALGRVLVLGPQTASGRCRGRGRGQPL